MDKPYGYYFEGDMWGRDGYYIAIGIEDYAFYFGSLAEAKKAACESHYTKPSNVHWKKVEK